MFQDSNTEIIRLIADQRHEELRRLAGASRLRRAARQAPSHRRRRHRAGPGR